jgi:hypothetical protein
MPVDKTYPLYAAWCKMRDRCRNPLHLNWDRYGGRGITICREWDSFKQFEEDMYDSWFPKAWLDRRDNNGNYNKDNCRWVTGRESGRNTSNAVLNMEKAEEIRRLYATGNYTYRKLGRIYGVSKTTIGFVVHNTQWEV